MLATPERARAVTVRWPARPHAQQGLHAGACLAWFVASMAVMFLTSNPLYLSLGFIAACVVYSSVWATAIGRAMRPVVAIGLVIAALSIPFNVLTGNSGSTVLATLPVAAFPRSFGGATFGGAITVEALVSALGRAITIATLIVLAAAFNAAVDHHRLLRLAPRSLAQVMLVLSIAVLVIPQAVEHGRAVVEARRLRGRAAGGLRSLPFVALPVLRGALERSVQRAESLDARGFGAQARRATWIETLLGVGGLGLCAWGAFADFYYGSGLLPLAAMAAGAAMVCAPLLRSARGVPRWRRPDPWSSRDVFVLGTALMSIALVLALRATGAGDVVYLPYPAVRMPAFQVVGAVAFILLITPALLSSAAEDGA